MRINIKQFELEFEKEIQSLESYIELGKSVFTYRMNYNSQTPKDNNDTSLGWEESYKDITICIKKEAFVSIEKYWSQRNNYWNLQLEANGFPSTINIYFEEENEDEMNKVYQKLYKFIFL